MRYLKVLGFTAAAEILSLFIGMTLATSSGTAMRLVSAVCTTGILVCFMANFALNCADSDLKSERNGGGKINPLVHAATGAVASLPALISWILLLVSHKSGSFDFYRWHKLLNAYFLQIYNFINPDASTAALTSGQVMGMLALVIIPFASFVLPYFLAYKRVFSVNKK